MKRFVLVTATLTMSTLAMAQSAPRVTEATFMKKERQDLESQTERKILEMLEQSRLREERARLQTIEGTSFNVQQAPVAAAPAAPAPLMQQEQTVQVVPVDAGTTQTW